MTKQRIGLWLPLLIFIVSSLLNLFYSDSLYIMGEKMIAEAQKYQSPLINSFFIFFTFLIQPYFVVTSLFLGMTLFKKKFQGAVMAVATLFNIFIFLVMKAFFLSPRPFWTSKEIRSIGYYCPKDYGSPSGHTQFAVFIFMLFLVHFNKNRKVWPYVLSLVTILLVMMSRMYLGGHSLDQVLFGFIVAACVIAVYETGGGKEKISQLLVNVNKGYVKKNIFLVIFLCHTIALIVYTINTQREGQYKKIFASWNKNFMKKCSKQISYSALNEASYLSETLVLNFIYGMFEFFSNLRNESQAQSYLKGYWSFNTKKYLFAVFPLYILSGLLFLAFPVGILYPVVIWFNNFFIAKLCCFNLGLFISPYFYGRLHFVFCKKMELIEIYSQQKIQTKND